MVLHSDCRIFCLFSTYFVMVHLENKMLRMIPLAVIWEECLIVSEACFWLDVMLVIKFAKQLACRVQLTDALNVRTIFLV